MRKCGSARVPRRRDMNARRQTRIPDDDRKRKQKEQIQCPRVIVSSDRNQGAIDAARVNAKEANVEGDIDFHQGSFSAAAEAFTTTGLCVLNPPYGDRIGDANLKHLYASFQASRSKTAKTGIVTSNQSLMRSFCPGFTTLLPPIFHGGKRVYFYA